MPDRSQSPSGPVDATLTTLVQVHGIGPFTINYVNPPMHQ